MQNGLLIITMILLSTFSFATDKTICGTHDDRVLSFDPRVGRLSIMKRNYGCTVTLIGKSCALSAGHCLGVLEKAEFNTPTSSNGHAKPAEPNDIYLIDKSTIVYRNDANSMAPGRDWAVMKIKSNPLTGKYPGELQGFYNVKFDSPKVGDTIRISGYGYDPNDKDKNFAQQTDSGTIMQIGSQYKGKSVLYHNIDTMGGNSGSTIRLDSTDEIIGIHTHGGCSSTSGANIGTLISESPDLIEAIQACLASDVL